MILCPMCGVVEVETADDLSECYVCSDEGCDSCIDRISGMCVPCEENVCTVGEDRSDRGEFNVDVDFEE